MGTYGHRSLIAWGCLLLAAACGGGGGADGAVGDALHPDMVEANAWDGVLPEGSTEVKPAEFSDGLWDGSLRLMTAAGLAHEEEASREQATADRALAGELYASTPDLLARLTVEPDASQPDISELLGGNFELRLPGAPGEADRVMVLLGKRGLCGDLVRARQEDRSGENQAGAYRTLYERLGPDVVSRLALPDPDDLGSSSAAAVKEEIQKIGTGWSTLLLPSGGKPPGYPSSAASEEGHGGLDGATYAPHTGMWPLIDFPLKWCVTSIKEHPYRGTGTAFAVTAAVEAIVARDHGRWTNLSEQTLYCKAMQEWWRMEYGYAKTYGDGAPIWLVLKHMTAFDGLTPRFVFSWESSWDYNRSPARVIFGNQFTGHWYGRSCWGTDSIPSYAGEYCSDTTHQAPMYNALTQWGDTYLACLEPVPVPSDARFRVVDSHCLGDSETLSLPVIKASLALKVPVILGIDVPRNMGPNHVDGSGIVPYPAWQTLGWHYVLLVGYVPNAWLPPGTPPGPGGGYFVCKQSWGGGYGDGGYCYLTDDWVSDQAFSAHVVEVEEWLLP